MRAFEPVVLVGTHVWLEPLGVPHVRPLLEAASESRATYTFTGVPGDEDSMRAYVDGVVAQREQGLALPFAIVDAVQARVVGTTRFLNVEYWAWPGERATPAPSAEFEAAEIGGTWLAESAQRTSINTEAKLLLLTLAFETWKLRRVNLKTDVRNARSRAAIERLGARLEGFFRAHMPAFDGGVRDTALYSLLAPEWPAAKAALELRLNARLETIGA